MAKSGTSHSDESSLHWKNHTSFGGEIDLTSAANCGGIEADGCRWIKIVTGSGSITLRGVDGQAKDAIDVAAGDLLWVRAKAIISVSGVTKVCVFY